jgi:hypothetical protein
MTEQEKLKKAIEELIPIIKKGSRRSRGVEAL